MATTNNTMAHEIERDRERKGYGELIDRTCTL
jgi:hypothetical protein